MSEQIDTSPRERAALYFIQLSVGGKVVPKELRQRLQDKGFVTALCEGGRRWLTERGDTIHRRGRE